MTDSSARNGIALITLISLGVIGILGPFGTDFYLPALPQMAQDLNVSESEIRFTLSIFSLGMALGQLILGTLSDRFGRKPLMVGGGIVVVAAALSASNAQNLATLLASCLVLGVGASSGLVTGRAVIADKTTGRVATRYFTLLQMSISLGPIIGPLAGAGLLTVGNWRTIFAVFSGVAVIGVLGAVMFVPETLPRDSRQSANPIRVLGVIAGIFRHRQFLLFAGAIWLGFGMLFAYISTTSFIFQSTLGVPSHIFALDFAFNGMGLITASIVTSRLALRYPAERFVLTGLLLQSVTMATLLVLTLSGLVTFWTFAVCVFLLTSSMGFVMGPATSLAVAPVRYASGTALALIGSFQFASAALSSTLTSAVSSDPLTAFLVIGSVATAAATTVAILGFRFIRSRTPQH